MTRRKTYVLGRIFTGDDRIRVGLFLLQISRTSLSVLITLHRDSLVLLATVSVLCLSVLGCLGIILDPLLVWDYAW